MELSLQPEEILLKKGRANHFEGAMGMIGRLYLTNKRLYFVTHPLNFKRYDFEVGLEDIAQINTQNNLYLFTRGVVIVLRNGETHRFALWNRAKWKVSIESACSHITPRV
jgi:hypothetical protein